MSLTELSTAIPERLPAQINYADLGTQFQAVTGKRSVHIQPSSGNTFSPEGIRVIRFNVTGEGYIVPETFRLQATFTVTGSNAYKPCAPMSCLFERVRVISSGQVLSDESYFDRLQSLHHEWMDKETFKEICAESFYCDMDSNGNAAFMDVTSAKPVRISMPFVTTPIFASNKKLIPIRYCPLVIEMQLQPTYTTMNDVSDLAEADYTKWLLSDINCLCDVLHLDPALDNLLQERHRTDKIPLKMREWHTMKQAVAENASEFTLQLLKGMTRLCSVCVTFEGPPENRAAYPQAAVAASGSNPAYAKDGKYKKTLNLYFPPGNREEFQWWIQIGTERTPVYPVRGMREARMRARQGLCHGPLSRQAYKGDLIRFGGVNGSSGQIAGRGFFALIDTEKICGSPGGLVGTHHGVATDLTGENTQGGKTIYAFFQELFTTYGITAAYMHVQYVKIVNLSSAGVEVEE